MTEKQKGVVLVSGGMDSTVVCGFASKKYVLAFLHINYGQKTEKRELTSFHSLADFYNVKERLIVDLHHFRQIGGSSLTDPNIAVPEGLSNEETPSTYVPFRNAQLLSVAISWAEVIGASAVFSGATEEDVAGYPDCRKEFYDVFNRLVDVGTKEETHIEVITPLIFMKKEAIVKLGIELGVPFEMTWSCYQNNEKACGKCDSCLRRLRAFSEAGFEDPIQYE